MNRLCQGKSFGFYSSQYSKKVSSSIFYCYNGKNHFLNLGDDYTASNSFKSPLFAGYVINSDIQFYPFLELYFKIIF